MSPDILTVLMILVSIGLGVFIAITIISSMHEKSQKDTPQYQIWHGAYSKENYAKVKAHAKKIMLFTEEIDVQAIGKHKWSYKPVHLLIFEDGIALYRVDLKLILAPHKDNLRGMFYTKDEKLRLHVSTAKRWYILDFDSSDFKNTREMDTFRKAINQMMPDELRRQSTKPQPHMHYGTSEAYFAEQRITGDWKLTRYAKLYLTPLFLVLMEVNGQVFREIPVEAINEIEALPRLDISTEGILRFRADGELFSFSVDNYEKWASQLALAASKAQEIPIEHDILEVKKKLEN